MYVNLIIAPLIFKLRLKTICQSLAITDETLVCNNDVNSQMRVGGSNKVEVNKVEKLREYS